MNPSEVDQFFSQTTIHAPLQKVDDPLLDPYGVQLYLKREDLIHPHISGNKWRKLKYNLIQAAADEYDTLLTFGGAYSNHILATAHAGQLLGFRTVGIIRGEEYSPLNPVLAEAQKAGMELHYMPRWRYRQKECAEVTEELASLFGRFYLLPEGGTNQLAVQGCREIAQEIDIPYDLICCACGTGGTLAGVISGLCGQQAALGIAVLKGESFLQEEISALVVPDSSVQWAVSCDYHFGGYARKNSELLQFIDQFYATQNIQLDPVYTGKLMFGIYDMIQRGLIPSGQTVVALHTGKAISSA